MKFLLRSSYLYHMMYDIFSIFYFSISIYLILSLLITIEGVVDIILLVYVGSRPDTGDMSPLPPVPVQRSVQGPVRVKVLYVVHNRGRGRLAVSMSYFEATKKPCLSTRLHCYIRLCAQC